MDNGSTTVAAVPIASFSPDSSGDEDNRRMWPFHQNQNSVPSAPMEHNPGAIFMQEKTLDSVSEVVPSFIDLSSDDEDNETTSLSDLYQDSDIVVEHEVPDNVASIGRPIVIVLSSDDEEDSGSRMPIHLKKKGCVDLETLTSDTTEDMFQKWKERQYQEMEAMKGDFNPWVDGYLCGGVADKMDCMDSIFPTTDMEIPPRDFSEMTYKGFGTSDNTVENQVVSNDQKNKLETRPGNIEDWINEYFKDDAAENMDVSGSKDMRGERKT